MSEYTLKKGEQLNGGYSITIGSHTLRAISAYKATWRNVYDTANSFTDYSGNTVKTLRGRQFELAVKTAPLVWDDYTALINALKPSNNDISVVCPDYTGTMVCDEMPADLKQANFLNTRYSVSFTLVAKSIVAAGSL